MVFWRRAERWRWAALWGALGASVAVAKAPAEDEAWARAFPTTAALIAALKQPATPIADGARAPDATPTAAPGGALEELATLLEDVARELYGTPEDEVIPTSTARGGSTPCVYDRTALRQPFMDAMIDGPAFAAWEDDGATVWIETESGLGEHVPLVAAPDPTWGWRAPLPTLAPGRWVLVLKPARGDARCTVFEVPSAPPASTACPTGVAGAESCTLLLAIYDRRYAAALPLLAGMPDEHEARRLAAYAACAVGHEPRDLAPDTSWTCKRIRRESSRR